MNEFAEYLSRFNDWPIWEKLLWALPVLAFLRLLWWLLEVVIDEKRGALVRVGAGVVLFIATLATIVVVVLIFGAGVENRNR